MKELKELIACFEETGPKLSVPEILARLRVIEAALMWMQGRELKLQFVLAKQPAQQEPTQCPICGEMVTATDVQPAQQQEPVKACVTGQCPCKSECDSAQCCLYTSPPAQRKPLSDEQIQEVVTRAVRERKLSWIGFKKDDKGEYTIPVLSPSDYQMARAIEAAHNIKDRP